MAIKTQDGRRNKGFKEKLLHVCYEMLKDGI